MTPEELRSIAGQCDSRATFESSGMTVSALIEAAAALRECADSLERAEPVAVVESVNGQSPRLLWYCDFPNIASKVSAGDKLYLHPPRSEPPKMTDAEITAISEPPKMTEAEITSMWLASRAALPRYLCFAREVEAFKNNQWRGE